MANDAACQWERAWLAADAAGDTVAEAEAVAVLGAIPAWDVIVAADGGGVVDRWTALAEAARLGVAATCAPEAGG